MRKDRCVAVSVLLAVAALLAAGCGGGPSKEEFVADLDKVCKTSNEKIQKIRAPQTVPQIAAFTRKSRVVLEDSIKEAEDLELPDEDKKGFERYISESRKSLDVLDDLEKAAEDNDKNAVRRIFAETSKENSKRDAQAKRLGLKQCGSG